MPTDQEIVAAERILDQFEAGSWTPTAETLKATKIGLFMNQLRKNPAASESIRSKANALTRRWAKAVAPSTIATNTTNATSAAANNAFPASSSRAAPPPPLRSMSSSSSLSAGNISSNNNYAPSSPVEVSQDPEFNPRTELRPSLGDKARDISVDLFVKALQIGVTGVDAKLFLWKARQIEDGLYREFVGVTDKYKSQFRTVVSNLKRPDNFKLRADILNGTIKAANVATMSAEDLMSESTKIAKQEAEKFNNHWAATAASTEAVTDEFKCGKCGQRKCTYYQKQTRSADEPMTTFVTCQSCGNQIRKPLGMLIDSASMRYMYLYNYMGFIRNIMNAALTINVVVRRGLI
ncbi:RNA polymerase II elongation factor, partial [Physocladia obscura]